MDLQDFNFDRTITIPIALASNDQRSQSTRGRLADLPGRWEGKGFNQIPRRHKALNGKPPKQGRPAELKLATETLEFRQIQGPIPDRGLPQGDLQMFDATNMQKISVLKRGAVDFKPGIRATIPASAKPAEGSTVARMTSIQRGTAILAQGKALAVDGKPPIADASITPFCIGNPSHTIASAESNPLGATPSCTIATAEITQDMVDDPNLVLASMLGTQNVTKTGGLTISTISGSRIRGGGTARTAFLQGSSTAGVNAAAAAVSAIFWNETIARNGDEPGDRQRQCTQTAPPNLDCLSWPQVSVASRKMDTSAGLCRPATRSERAKTFASTGIFAAFLGRGNAFVFTAKKLASPQSSIPS